MVETCNLQKVTALLVRYLREDLRHPLFQSVQGFLKEDNEHTMWLVIVKNCRYTGVCFYTHLNQANTDWCKPVMRENCTTPTVFQTPSLKNQKNFCLPLGKRHEFTNCLPAPAPTYISPQTNPSLFGILTCLPGSARIYRYRYRYCTIFAELPPNFFLEFRYEYHGKSSLSAWVGLEIKEDTPWACG